MPYVKFDLFIVLVPIEGRTIGLGMLQPMKPNIVTFYPQITKKTVKILAFYNLVKFKKDYIVSNKP